MIFFFFCGGNDKSLNGKKKWSELKRIEEERGVSFDNFKSRKWLISSSSSSSSSSSCADSIDSIDLPLPSISFSKSLKRH